MGASVSTNSSEIITKAINNISSDLIQKSIQNSDQSIVIKVEDTQGDVNISGINARQQANINSNALFTNISDTNNSNRVNQEIEKLTKAVISGLNLGQISASVSTLSNIIENCITIKNNGIAECSTSNNQNFSISVEKTGGSVNITNLSIQQLTTNFSSCIANNSQSNTIRTDTDLKLKQITSSSAEGLDIKWIALAVAVAIAAFGVVSVSSISKIIGPIMMGVGIGFIWYGYRQRKTKVVNNPIYIKNKLQTTPNIGTLSIIKTEQVSKNDDVICHGDADFYETFAGTIILYKGNINNVENLDSYEDIKESDIELKTAGNGITIKITGDKYSAVRIDVSFPVSETKIIKPDDPTKENGVYVIADNFEFTHKLKIVNSKKELIQDYFIEPTIVSYKSSSSNSDLLKNSNIIIGASLICLGLVVTVTNSIGNKK